MNKKVLILLFGPPGGGKGTISKRLIQDFNLSHLSSGDLLRDEINRKTSIGKEAEKFIKAGQLVSDETIFKLFTQKISTLKNKILLDGFPRTRIQCVQLENNHSINLVLNIKVPHNEIIQRLTDRWIDPSSGRIYSYSYNPPKKHGLDDISGERLIQRPDDIPEIIEKRLESYEKETIPLLSHFEALKILHSSDGSAFPTLIKQNKRSDAIYKSLKPFVEKLINPS